MITSKELEDNTELFRIMPLERFLQMLSTKKNVLVHPSSWKDPYESLVKKSGMILEPGQFVPYELDRWYGQCWSSNPCNDALWQIYTKSDNCRAVMIKTTIGALKESIPEDNDQYRFFLGKVKYADHAKDEKGTKKNLASIYQFDWDWENPLLRFEEVQNDEQLRAVYMLLTKRKPFEYEQEVRLLCYTKEKQEDGLYKYDLNIMNFVKEVTLDPWTPKGIDTSIKDIIDSFFPGNSIQVGTSNLYTDLGRGFLYDPHHYYEEYIKQHN